MVFDSSSERAGAAGQRSLPASAVWGFCDWGTLLQLLQNDSYHNTSFPCPRAVERSFPSVLGILGLNAELVSFLLSDSLGLEELLFTKCDPDFLHSLHH